MKLSRKLNSFHLVERESNLSLVRWTYPTVDDDIRELILAKCFTVCKTETCYALRAKNNWLYTYQWKNENVWKAVVVTAEHYDPEKYRVLCGVFARMYNKTGNPVDLVKLYLNLIIRGNCSFQENGSVVTYNLDSFKSETNLKELISVLGPEIVFLYNAILLKKRIVISHPNIQKLQKDIFSAINLVTIRKENEYLMPLVDNVKLLKGIPFYLAGVTNKDFKQYSDLYDLFLDLMTAEFTLGTNAKESLTLTKMHKDLAHFMIDSCKNDTSDQEIIADISARTRDLLKGLDAIATITGHNQTKMISMEDLKNKNLNPQTENFLYQLAVAENMMML